MARDFEAPKGAADDIVQQHVAQDTGALTLPDGVALFEAQYDRVGQDLVLSEQGAPVFTLPDYFLTATPADLVAANGAVLPGALAARLAGSNLDAQYAQSGGGATSTPIGQVEAVSGLATVQRIDGTVEDLTVGLKIYQNDILSTTIDGKTSVTFSDGTIFSLAQSSRMVIDTLIYDPEGSENAGSFTLLTGGFVFIAGQVAKTGDMDVNTPTATLGIRGTTVQVDIQMVDGVATLNVSLNRDFDGAIGSIVMTDLDGNLIATITTTDTQWIISPIDGQTREVVRTSSDLATDSELLADAFSAFQSAILRVEAGETFVELGSGVETDPTPITETVDPLPTPDDGGTDPSGDPQDLPPQPSPTEGDNNDSSPADVGPEDDASILNDGILPSILPPTAENVEVAGIEDLPDGVPISGRVTATGGDTDAMVFAVATDPSNGTVTINEDGTFSYVPDADFSGTDVFTYVVTQGSGSTAVSDTGQITVSVSAVNDAPIAQDAVFSVNEDSSVTGTVSAFDPDGDPITFSIVAGQGPTNGTVVMQPDGAFAYVPDADFSGTDSFTYMVNDGSFISINENLFNALDGTDTTFSYTNSIGLDGTNTATISVTVAGVQDAPVAQDTSIVVTEDTVFSGSVTATDVDGDDLTFTAVADQASANGTVVMQPDGTYVFTPDADYTGPGSFSYTVTDSAGDSDT
ncbi:MAG: VCBS repeat-containing protein, partial [Ascidiaceihabitans sp.]